jgi:hypothetical protein
MVWIHDVSHIRLYICFNLNFLPPPPKNCERVTHCLIWARQGAHLFASDATTVSRRQSTSVADSCRWWPGCPRALWQTQKKNLWRFNGACLPACLCARMVHCIHVSARARSGARTDRCRMAGRTREPITTAPHSGLVTLSLSDLERKRGVWLIYREREKTAMLLRRSRVCRETHRASNRYRSSQSNSTA